MLKRLRAWLLGPLISKMEKALERMMDRIKHQETLEAESKRQLKDRMNMLSRQVDEAREEFHRGFRIQETSLEALRQQLNPPSADRLRPVAIEPVAVTNLDAPSTRVGAASPSLAHPSLAPELYAVSESSGRDLLRPQDDADSPFVTVVMPVWNRSGFVERALRSVQAQTEPRWECLVVDDGSEDGCGDIVAALAKEDPRIILIRREHHGAAAARNVALRCARGGIVAYLDSDNAYSPDYLARVIEAFNEDPSLMCCYARQRVIDAGNGSGWVRGESFDWQRLLQANFIDLSVFSHRRRLWEELGGFDESLKRLQDWDLILRYTEHSRVAALPLVGGEYRSDADNRISGTGSTGYATFLIHAKLKKAAATSGPRRRVLYALWRYPQLNESHIRHEMLAAIEEGFEIEVWAEWEADAAYQPDAPVHRGELLDAVKRFKPDVIHVHWLNVARLRLGELATAGVPVTVRAHAFDFHVPVVDELARSPMVRGIYLPSDQVRAYGKTDPKVRNLRTGIHPRWHYPSDGKDRKLVLRAAGGLPSKDFATFLETAQLCPDHEFVLIVCRCEEHPTVIDDLRSLNESMGRPAAILADTQHESVAQWMMRAGIYLHTVRLTGANPAPLGMPVSVIEAMACGCVPLLRRHPSFQEAFGQADPLWYDNAQEAATLVRSTESWTNAEWNRRLHRGLDCVYPDLISSEAHAGLYADWRTAAIS